MQGLDRKSATLNELVPQEVAKREFQAYNSVEVACNQFCIYSLPVNEISVFALIMCELFVSFNLLINFCFPYKVGCHFAEVNTDCCVI